MKKLFVLLLCHCLLVPLASGQQGYVQQRGDRAGERPGDRPGDRAGEKLGDKLGQLADQIRKRGSDDSRPVPNKFGSQDETLDQPSVSRRDATDKAREAYPGRVLGIRREGDNWRVRMDNDGRVFNVLVDAESGTVARPSE